MSAATAVEVAMPRLSDSMEEATIVRWLAASGDEIARGADLIEIETDKATVTYESEAAGVLETLVAEGETVALGAPIARIHPAGTPLDATASAPPAPAPSADAAPAEPAAPAVAPAQPAAPAPAANGHALAAPAARPNASPLARRIAADLGVDLAALAGSGPGGRIVKADVLAARPDASAAAPAPVAAPAAPTASASAPADAGGRGDVTVEQPTRAQQVVARRMAEAKATVPEFTTSIDVDLQAAVELREQLRGTLAEGEPLPSLNDFVVKAVARALRDVPRANGRWHDGAFELFGRVNVGIAVARPDGLVVPTIRDADEKSLGTLAREARRLATAVRDGSVTPAELASGTFTVSNLGMFGIASFTAILNQGQAGILAVGAAEQRAVVRDGELVARWICTLTLTADHRILYGADAAAFLAAVRERLQSPMGLLL